MILYYALGGGLGHLTRSLALLEQAPAYLQQRCRLLASSHSAELARCQLPCPLDLIPDQAMQQHSQYHQFLHHYLAQHRFSAIIIDSFPFGLLGELAWIAPQLPRILIGRYLRWEAYTAVCSDPHKARWPDISLLIEEQPDDYLQALRNHSDCRQFSGPVAIKLPADRPAGDQPKRCCVVHSGSPDELAALVALAYEVAPGKPDLVTPQRGLFPVERQLQNYSDVISGAGYGSCAAAVSLQGQVRFHLHPFPRRYDDQQLRLKRLTAGNWGGTDPQAATADVAAPLWQTVGSW